MRRRQFLKGVSASAFGVTLASQRAAAECNFEPGVWYDGEVVNVTDGDTFDVVLDCDGQEYEIRHLGLDTPETSSNSRYEEVREWEGIEDENYLTDWGGNASDYAQNEFPDGTPCQIAVDENEDTFDPFGRLLAYVRYDKNGDGSMDTVYNYDVVRKGYARVYSSSLTKHDEYWQAEHDAQSEGLRVWQQSDPENTSEVGNDPVSTVYFPDASSVRTSNGAIADSRVPVYAESTATQSLDSGGVDYADIPMVGVDEANNAAMIGGLFIDESLESEAEGEHRVFLSNLVDYLSSKSGKVLIEGGHRQFNDDYGLSSEDAVVYQRFLEGVGLPFEAINAVDDDTYDNRLSSARGIIVTNSPQSFTTSEKEALANYVSNGGAVILMGSAGASATMRSNLHDVAAGIGSDLRLNADQVFDDTNNTGDSSNVTTTVFDTSFPLFDSYTPDSGSSNDPPNVSWVTPADGDTVSGTVTVQVDASDSEDGDDSLDVTYTVDGGSSRSTTYNSTSGYYEDSWDTTTVSDGDHTLEATVTDSAGATSSSTITVTTDNTESAPAVDSLSLTEVETSDSDAEFDADWQVSDSDGNLSSVDLTLTDDTAGETEDTATVSVSGDTASGTTRLVAAGDDGSGNSYTVELVVSDSAGNSSSDTATATESEGRSDVLTADPNTENVDSYHTWTLADPSFSGDVGTITVDYPSGTSLDGLTNDNVLAYVDNDGDGTAEEIRVNSDSYSGSTATFDLDGRYDTTVNGEVRVEVDGVTNPGAGDYIATETLDGDDSLTVDAEYVVSTSSLTVSTGSATSVGTDSATLNGSLDDLGGASSADCYFEYRQVGASSWNTTTAQTLSSTGSFSDTVSGLSAGTDYEFRAVADASDGSSDTGSTASFTTSSESALAVTTDSASNVTGSSATLNGSLDDLGGASSADCYFEYRQVGASSWNATAVQTLSSTGTFSDDVSGLSSGTDYEFRAVADAADGDSDTGTTASFTTDSTSTAPAIDGFALFDNSNPQWDRYDVDWTVSDADGDLDTVVTEMLDSSGTVLDSDSDAVGGGSASGTHSVRSKQNASQIVLTVTDAAGNSTSDTKSV